MRRDYRNPTRKSRVANSGRAAPYDKYGENIVQIKKGRESMFYSHEKIQSQIWRNRKRF